MTRAWGARARSWGTLVALTSCSQPPDDLSRGLPSSTETASAAPVAEGAPPAPPQPRPPELEPLPLAIGVVHVAGEPVVTDAWLAAEVAEAERLLSPFGVHVTAAARRTLDVVYAEPASASERDDLARELVPGALNVFVVERLHDLYDPGDYRKAVRWRSRRRRHDEYVILSSRADATSLAHELGHVLGNDHSHTRHNAMSYRRSEPALVFFDAEQGGRMRRHAARWLVRLRLQL